MSGVLQQPAASLSDIADCLCMMTWRCACILANAGGATLFNPTSCATPSHVSQSEAADGPLEADRRRFLSRRSLRPCPSVILAPRPLESAFIAVLARLPSSAVWIR